MNKEHNEALTEDRLQAYLDGELSRDEHEAIAASLAEQHTGWEPIGAMESLHLHLNEGMEVLEPPEQPTQEDARRALLRLQQRLSQGPQAPESQPQSKEAADQSAGWSLWRWLYQPWAWGAVATAAIVLALQLPPMTTSQRQSITPKHPQKRDRLHTTMKNGRPQLAVFLARQRPGTTADTRPSDRYYPTRQLRSGAQAAPGDLLQFALRLPHTSHCLIMSINERGELYVYLPLEKEHSIRLPPGEHLYPPKGSMELDRSAGKERIFAFFGQRPLPVAAIKRAFQDQRKRANNTTPLEALKAPQGPWLTRSFWLDKGPARR